MTYADHVVVVTATSDRAIPPDEETAENQEGYVHRKATLRVDDVIWSRDDASHPAPAGSFEWDAWGWTLHDGERIPMAGEDAPRVEVGHTYIIAIVWQPIFDDGYDFVPAHWNGLGSDAVIPYDGGVIGKGELEGTEHSRALARPSSDPNFSLEDEMAGISAEAVAAALRSPKRGPRLGH